MLEVGIKLGASLQMGATLVDSVQKGLADKNQAKLSALAPLSKAPTLDPIITKPSAPAE